MFTSLTRIFYSGWKNFKRQLGFGLATVIIMTMIISVVTSLFLLRETSNFLIADLEEKVDLRVYFEKDFSTDELLSIQEELSKFPEIRSMEYVSRDEALRKFTERHKNNPVIMDSLEEVGINPLLASLNINAWEVDHYASIAGFLEASPFSHSIAKIDYAQKKPAIERLFSVTSTVGNIGIFLGLILALVVAVIVFNTARLAIYNSRAEIEIMKLVGASNWFIRGPFLVQGAICGFLATLVALLLFTGVLYFISPKLEVLAPGLNLFAFLLNSFFVVIAIQLVVGVGLGILSSWFAAKKYLKI